MTIGIYSHNNLDLLKAEDHFLVFFHLENLKLKEAFYNRFGQSQFLLAFAIIHHNKFGGHLEQIPVSKGKNGERDFGSRVPWISVGLLPGDLRNHEFLLASAMYIITIIYVYNIYINIIYIICI
jgi:hypothetical protein